MAHSAPRRQFGIMFYMPVIRSERDTIAAIATASGKGALCVIRLSGPDALKAASKFLRRNGKPAELRERMAELFDLTDGTELLDKTIATFYKAPRTFTGEDMVELSCHASPYIASRVLALCVENGARPAEPGEFSRRAFLNGKMDLAQAEGICDLIAASSAQAHRAAISLTEGRLSRTLEEMKTGLQDLLAEMEGRLDDPDDELPPLDKDAALARLSSIENEMRALCKTFRYGSIVKNGIASAIAGAPNSGKSSLLNALAGYDRAIVSPTAGTTRDTVEETIDIGGILLRLTDTAGIREHALDPAEAEGIRRTKAAIAKADLIFFVLDLSRDLSEDLPVWELIKSGAEEGGKTIIAVLNKADIAPAGKPLPAWLEGVRKIAVSTKTGDGVAELRQLALEAVSREDGGDSPMILTSSRHYEALLGAAEETAACAERLSAGGEPELCAEHLRVALNSLGQIAGETTPDDILGIVFGKFCVGK